jgi:hypothetical protein
MSSSTMNKNNSSILTRSEATNLVELYLRATNNPLSEKSRKGKYGAPMATFRTMTQYQPRTGSSLNGKGPLDKYAFPSDMFFNTIKELIDAVGKKEPFGVTQKRIRTTFMQNIEKNQSLQILQFLSCAIDNYLQKTHEHIENVLGDNTCEYNTCSVCEWSGTDYFYYSTTYGLNLPVCIDCVFVDEDKKEFDGEVEVNDEEEVSAEEEVSESDEDEDDDEYVPSDEEESSDEEDEADEEDEEDEDLYNKDPNCQENNDTDEPEKFFGCEGCQYEWRDGWQKGWKSAMKQIKKFAKQQKRPENIRIPECDYCGASHNLKKCSGTCEGVVRYCSIACQKKDWLQGHKQECCANQ